MWYNSWKVRPCSPEEQKSFQQGMSLSRTVVRNLFGLWPPKTEGCLFATTQHGDFYYNFIYYNFWGYWAWFDNWRLQIFHISQEESIYTTDYEYDVLVYHLVTPWGVPTPCWEPEVQHSEVTGMPLKMLNRLSYISGEVCHEFWESCQCHLVSPYHMHNITFLFHLSIKVSAALPLQPGTSQGETTTVFTQKQKIRFLILFNPEVPVSK